MILYFLIIYAVIVLGAAAALYILHGIGLSTMLRRSGFKKPWFAYVPFCRVFALGCLADQCRDILPPKKRGHKLLYFSIAYAALGLIYLIANGFAIYEPTVDFFKSIDALIANASNTFPMEEFLAIVDGYEEAVYATETTALGALSLLSSIATMLYEVYMIFVLMRVYRIFAPNASFALTLLSIFVEPAKSIIFFVIRKKPLRNMRWQEPEQNFDTPPFGM